MTAHAPGAPDRATVPVVLVHGNPETPAVWGPVAALLGRPEVHAPSLPGFGCPTPSGFGSTKEDYADWLVGVLEALGGPAHLVGHDWGGILTVRVAETRPDLLVSWCSDAVAMFHPAYVWHDLARVWQTPGEGEATVEAMAALDPAVAVAGLEALGIPSPQAIAFVTELGADTGASVLTLYRSAVPELLVSWRAAADAAGGRPGLAVRATGDPYSGDDRLVLEAASAMGAEVVTMDGLGHWWMLEDPGRAARTLLDWFARHEG
jgi:pimeloyl-ACP methyl ester carboxylesterase